MSAVVYYGNLVDHSGFYLSASRSHHVDGGLTQTEALEFERYSTLEEAKAYADIAVAKYGALGPYRVINEDEVVMP